MKLPYNETSMKTGIYNIYIYNIREREQAFTFEKAFQFRLGKDTVSFERQHMFVKENFRVCGRLVQWRRLV